MSRRHTHNRNILGSLGSKGTQTQVVVDQPGINAGVVADGARGSCLSAHKRRLLNLVGKLGFPKATCEHIETLEMFLRECEEPELETVQLLMHLLSAQGSSV